MTPCLCSRSSSEADAAGSATPLLSGILSILAPLCSLYPANLGWDTIKWNLRSDKVKSNLGSDKIKSNLILNNIVWTLYTPYLGLSGAQTEEVVAELLQPRGVVLRRCLVVIFFSLLQLGQGLKKGKGVKGSSGYQMLDKCSVSDVVIGLGLQYVWSYSK